MKKTQIAYYIGNLMVLLSLISFLYIFLPVIQIYLFPPAPPAQELILKQGFYISIPKINAYSEVIANIDPWNEAVYQKALKRGVAHAKGTFFPGENKTIFLFAHSSGVPWEITRTNTVFLRLGDLIPNDLIILNYKSKNYTYKVSKKEEVSPTQTEYLTQLQDNRLILQTCTPIGTSLKRLLIFANPAQ